MTVALDRKNARRGDYKEYYDKSQNQERVITESECAKWAMSGRCESGHIFLKKLNCGIEWCPWCGQENSWIHERRIGRWLPKLQKMKSVGYFVIELPLESRAKLRSKEALEDFGKEAKRIFKTRLDYDRGLRRWHFFGDDNPEVRGYNPHLNILVDGGYLSYDRLEFVKSVLRSELNEPDLIVHYEYRATIPEMMHSLRYVTRATFLDYCWDPELAEAIRGFKNQQVWGNWKKYETLWTLDSDDRTEAVAKLESGLCPCCGKPIVWDKGVVTSLMIDVCNAVDIGGGYYQVPDKDPPDPLLTKEDFKRLADWKEGALLYKRNLQESFMEDPAAVYRLYCRRQELVVDLKTVNRIRRNAGRK